jgi:hypothetical protein
VGVNVKEGAPCWAVLHSEGDLWRSHKSKHLTELGLGATLDTSCLTPAARTSGTCLDLLGEVKCDSSRQTGDLNHNSQNPIPSERSWVELWGESSGDVRSGAAPNM